MSDPDNIYRVICFDADRKIVTSDLIEADSDEQAIAMAEAAGFGTKCEVWQGQRLVAQLEADRRQA